MTESGLTTAREREEFKALVRDFLAHNLANAPRAQLQAIERAMFRWAQAYRNAAALLVLTVQPRPKLIGRCADAR
jgi:hypothetical protein